MRLATAPVTVNEAVPLVPVRVKPVMEAKVSVPCVTESVTESLPEPALASVNEIWLAPEKARLPFWLTEADEGAVITGAVTALMVRATLPAADWPSAASETEIASVSAPT